MAHGTWMNDITFNGLALLFLPDNTHNLVSRALLQICSLYSSYCDLNASTLILSPMH
jgi:hypothetical protein